MANFDKIKIDGTSYMVHDTATATALSAETQARQQAIQRLEGEIADLPDEWKDDFRKIIVTADFQTIGGRPTQAFLSGMGFIATDGFFYRVTQNIISPSTTTWRVGTNCNQTTIQDYLYSLRTAIDDVDQQITEQLEPLDTRVTSVENTIDSLNIYNFSNCVFLGDSYMNQNPKWGDVLASILPGCREHHNFASGGGGFQIAGDQGSFLSMFQTGGAIYNGAQSYKDTVTFVLIEGGINDGDQESGPEVTAVRNTINAAKSLFPAARIAVVYNWVSRAYPNTIWDGIKKGCEETGTAFCPNSYLWLWADQELSYFQSDRIHPNATGTNIACRCIYQWLISGHASWPGTPQKFTLSNGMSLIWFIDEFDNVNVGIYGTATSNTSELGRISYCLKPYKQSLFIPWLNLTQTTNNDHYIRVDTNQKISTNAVWSTAAPISEFMTSFPARQLGFMGFTV